MQQQLQSLNSLYDQVKNIQGGLGFDVRQQQFQQAGNAELTPQTGGMGSTSLDALARNLAQNYGMPIGRGRIVDENGNLLMTPQQIADASGGQVTLGEAATQLQMISQAIANKRNEQQQQKGIAALQTGLGQVQSRGRGSLAALQMGLYEGLADMYSNQEYEAADYSYFVQKEQLDIQQELMRKQEEMQKKQSRMGFFGGLLTAGLGFATGNVGMGVGGLGQTFGSAAGTGWFDF